MGYELTDMMQLDSGCKLAGDVGFILFKGIYDLTKGNPCDGCPYDASRAADRISFATSPCEFINEKTAKEKQVKAANFGKHAHETNAEIGERLGVSGRQVAKMRKRGEL